MIEFLERHYKNPWDTPCMRTRTQRRRIYKIVIDSHAKIKYHVTDPTTLFLAGVNFSNPSSNGVSPRHSPLDGRRRSRQQNGCIDERKKRLARHFHQQRKCVHA